MREEHSYLHQENNSVWRSVTNLGKLTPILLVIENVYDYGLNCIT